MGEKGYLTKMTDVIKPSAHDGGTVYHTDLLTLCGELIRRGQKVDMILCDLPYAITDLQWDVVIPLEPMWESFRRVVKPNGAIVLTATQPFTSVLVMSNLKMFRHEWVWDKVQPSGQLNAKYQPMKQHETILIFSVTPPFYDPQFSKRHPKDVRVNAKKNKLNQSSKTSFAYVGGRKNRYSDDYDPTMVYPKTILTYSRQPTRDALLHPTQKPVDLFRYLIRTYTRPGELVFDPCVGSGTTAVAARAEGRRYIVGDISAEYVAVTREQLRNPFDSHYVIKVDKPLDKPIVQIDDEVLEQTTLFD